MDELNGLKAGVTAVLALIAAVLGNLFIPVGLMVCCNVIDYATGLMAVPQRKEELSSYRSLKGIIKKEGMWLLVVVGAIVDELIRYAGTTVGVQVPVRFLFACVVAIWLICSELISILENIVDMGVALPPFLLPVIKLIQKQTEEKTKLKETKQKGEENEGQDETASETTEKD